MTRNLVISGETLTGKTLVALAAAAKFKERGMTVSYFKPAGEKSYTLSDASRAVDEDAVLMKEVLGMDADLGCICPIVRTMSSYDELIRIGHDELLQKILDCYEKISGASDVVIIEGTAAPWHLLHVGLSTPQIAARLGASVVCLVNFPDITAIDEVLLQRDFFRQHGIEEIGIVLNMVPPMLKGAIEGKIGKFLDDNGVHFCGVIYQHKELFSPTIRDILRALDGQMIVGEDNLDILIGEFMVGSMIPENALKWFRRAKNKAVITSGDRADLCHAAMETDTNLLILTGGLGPDFSTVARARELGVSVMMTDKDTYSTGQIVDDLIGSVNPEDHEKIEIVQRIVGEAINLVCLGF